MAAITAGTMRPDSGVQATKVVVPISWMAQHDVSVTSNPAVRSPSEDVSIEAAEMELAQAQAEAANAKARAAEAKLHLIRAHKSQDSGNNSASGVSSSHPSALVDLSQELSHIMDEGEMQSPNTQYFQMFGGSEEDDVHGVELPTDTVLHADVPRISETIAYGGASGSGDAPERTIVPVPTVAETIRYPVVPPVPTCTVPGVGVSSVHTPALPTATQSLVPAVTVDDLHKQSLRYAETIRRDYEEQARQIVVQTIASERSQMEDAATKAITHAQQQAEMLVATEREQVAIAANQAAASLRTQAFDAVARERQQMADTANQAVATIRADAEDVIARERAQMTEWAAQQNQLAAAMKSKDDQVLVQRFMQERERLDAAARVSEETKLQSVEEHAIRRLRELEFEARDHVAAMQRSIHARDEELLEQQEAARKQTALLHQEAEARMAELQHGLRMQAAAESAEAWASYKLDFKAAHDRELVATERQSEVEATLAGYKQHTADLQERNKQLALNVEQLTEALRRVPVPNSPDTAGGGYTAPAVVMAAGTQTITAAKVTTQADLNPPNPPDKGGNPDQGPTPPSGDPSGSGQGGGDKNNRKGKPNAPPQGNPDDPPDGGGGGGGGGGPNGNPATNPVDPTRQPDAVVVASRAKEAETIKIAQLPNPIQFQAWQDSVRHEIAAASGRHRQAFPWILRVEDPEVSFEDLAEPEEFESLDAKLSAALRKVTTGALGRKITRLSNEDARKRGRLMSGRQTLWMIYQDFRMDERQVGLFSLEELFKVTLAGDNLVKFLEDWDLAVANLEKEPDEDVMETLVVKQLRKSSKLKVEIKHWDRLERGHPDRNYAWLIDCAKREVRRDRQDYVRKELETALTHAAAAKGKGKKGKGKGGKGSGAGESICFEFRDTGKCSKPNCPYKHVRGSGGKSKGGKGAGGGRKGGEPKGGASDAPPAPGSRSDRACSFHKRGKCKFGDQCAYSHAAPAADAKAKAKPKAKGKAKAKPAAVASTIPIGCAAGRLAASGGIHSAVSGSLTSSAPASRNAGPGIWLGDTGSGVDLIGKQALTREDVKDVYQSAQAQQLATANGVLFATDVVDMQVSALREVVSPYVLENTPAVLSIGKRCMQDGYEFRWRPNKAPYFITPQGRKVVFEVENFVPYFRENPCGDQGEAAYASPAPQRAAPEGEQPAADAIAAAGGEEVVPVEPTPLKAEAKSTQHLMTHLPKNPHCEICCRTKVTKAQARRKLTEGESAEVFGERITADHLICGDEPSRGVDDEKVALVLLDRATRWVEVYPAARKSTQETMQALRNFGDGDGSLENLYSDNAPELLEAAALLGIRHDTSTPYNSPTNGVAERNIRMILDGTRTALEQSGLGPVWWPRATRHFCHSLNTTIKDGDSPWNRRHKAGQFAGKRIPFGALVDIRPPEPVLKQMPKFGPRTVPAVFLGYHLNPGGRWRSEYLAAPLEDFKTDSEVAKSDTASSAGKRKRVVRIFRVKEVVATTGRPWNFPLRDSRDRQTRSVQAADPTRVGIDFAQGTAIESGRMLSDQQLPSSIEGVQDGVARTVESADVAPPQAAADATQTAGSSSSAPPAGQASSSSSSANPRVEGAVPDEGGYVDRIALLDPDAVPEFEQYGDRVVKRRPGSGRVPGIWPETWQSMSYHARTQATKDWYETVKAKMLDKKKPESSASTPSVPAVPVTVTSGLAAHAHTSDVHDVVASDQEVKDRTVDAAASAASGVNTVATGTVVHEDTPPRGRCILEFCTDDASILGQCAPKDCDCIRITESVDATSEEGLQTCLKTAARPNTLVWAAIPCTGGSAWQHVNKRFPTARKKIRAHRALFKKLWCRFEAVARVAREHGNKLAIEWPRACAYWRSKSVKRFIAEYGLKIVKVDGCSFGLTDGCGTPVRKPWSVATDDENIGEALERRCPGHATHTPVAGKLTAGTASYPTEMAEAIHRAWRKSCASRPKPSPSAVTTASSGDSGHAAVCGHHSVDDGRSIEQIMADFAKKYNDHDIPTMPTQSRAHVHRDKSVEPIFGMVVRQLTKAEIAADPKAQKSLTDEFNRLSNKVVWEIDEVREWPEVSRESQRSGIPVNVGRLFGIAGIKHDEMPEEYKSHKGRFVFEGSDVRDEFGQPAEFADMSSSPATLEAFKLVDSFGLFPGHSVETSDAEQAYVQSELRGTKTWLRLPKDRWPAEWSGKYHDPVVPMRLALYGHPDSGGYWEEHCSKQLISVGFTPVPEWPSMFFHAPLQLLLSVYVDDFKMAGPTGNLQQGWTLIKDKIHMDNPTPVGRALGCEHRVDSRKLKNGKTVQTVEYDMEPFLKDCVAKYLELAHKPMTSLKRVPTPFLEENDERVVDLPPEVADAGQPAEASSRTTKVERPETDDVGALKPIACKILMKVLYAARMCRFDLLKAIALLASRVTKWDRDCDRRLHRLISYINSTLELRLTGYVGDNPSEVSLALYSDADFAGCKNTARSTTGVFLALVGPNTFVPLAAVSKRQTCVSHSTAEAEIVAANTAVRTIGLPTKVLMEFVLNKDVDLVLHEDNQATLRVIKTGRSPALRHLSRTHHVNIAWLTERVNERELHPQYVDTSKQASDIFTKSFTNLVKWMSALQLLGMVYDVKAFEAVHILME